MGCGYFAHNKNQIKLAITCQEVKTKTEEVSSMTRRKTNSTTSTKVSESQTIIAYTSRTSTEWSLKGAYVHTLPGSKEGARYLSHEQPNITYFNLCSVDDLQICNIQCQECISTLLYTHSRENESVVCLGSVVLLGSVLVGFSGCVSNFSWKPTQPNLRSTLPVGPG